MSDGIRIEADTAAALAELQRMEQRGEALAPLLSLIGEDIVERVKGRFAAGKGPDGQAWAANSPVTLAREALRLAVSKGNRNKGGGLNARGQRTLAGKRPLIGEGKTLSTTGNFWQLAGGNALEIGNSQVYAAIQQFGGTKGQFPHLWGDIPARPFMPVTSAGDLYPAESDAIVAAINDYILDR
jgi:phage gpG-like protein